MLMMQWNVRPTGLRLATDADNNENKKGEWGIVHEEREREREQEQRGGLPSEASTFRSALHVVKYGCGQFSNNNSNNNR